MSVMAILFGKAIGAEVLTGEALAFLGTITGASITFLFLAKTKNNGSLVGK